MVLARIGIISIASLSDFCDAKFGSSIQAKVYFYCFDCRHSQHASGSYPNVRPCTGSMLHVECYARADPAVSQEHGQDVDTMSRFRSSSGR
jgi:hypothetical protein